MQEYAVENSMLVQEMSLVDPVTNLDALIRQISNKTKFLAKTTIKPKKNLFSNPQKKMGANLIQEIEEKEEEIKDTHNSPFQNTDNQINEPPQREQNHDIDEDFLDGFIAIEKQLTQNNNNNITQKYKNIFTTNKDDTKKNKSKSPAKKKSIKPKAEKPPSSTVQEQTQNINIDLLSQLQPKQQTSKVTTNKQQYNSGTGGQKKEESDYQKILHDSKKIMQPHGSEEQQLQKSSRNSFIGGEIQRQSIKSQQIHQEKQYISQKYSSKGSNYDKKGSVQLGESKKIEQSSLVDKNDQKESILELMYKSKLSVNKTKNSEIQSYTNQASNQHVTSLDFLKSRQSTHYKKKDVVPIAEKKNNEINKHLVNKKIFDIESINMIKITKSIKMPDTQLVLNDYDNEGRRLPPQPGTNKTINEVNRSLEEYIQTESQVLLGDEEQDINFNPLDSIKKQARIFSGQESYKSLSVKPEEQTIKSRDLSRNSKNQSPAKQIGQKSNKEIGQSQKNSPLQSKTLKKQGEIKKNEDDQSSHSKSHNKSREKQEQSQQQKINILPNKSSQYSNSSPQKNQEIPFGREFQMNVKNSSVSQTKSLMESEYINESELIRKSPPKSSFVQKDNNNNNNNWTLDLPQQEIKMVLSGEQSNEIDSRIQQEYDEIPNIMNSELPSQQNSIHQISQYGMYPPQQSYSANTNSNNNNSFYLGNKQNSPSKDQIGASLSAVSTNQMLIPLQNIISLKKGDTENSDNGQISSNSKLQLFSVGQHLNSNSFQYDLRNQQNHLLEQERLPFSNERNPQLALMQQQKEGISPLQIQSNFNSEIGTNRFNLSLNSQNLGSYLHNESNPQQEVTSRLQQHSHSYSNSMNLQLSSQMISHQQEESEQINGTKEDDFKRKFSFTSNQLDESGATNTYNKNSSRNNNSNSQNRSVLSNLQNSKLNNQIQDSSSNPHLSGNDIKLNQASFIEDEQAHSQSINQILKEIHQKSNVRQYKENIHPTNYDPPEIIEAQLVLDSVEEQEFSLREPCFYDYRETGAYNQKSLSPVSKYQKPLLSLNICLQGNQVKGIIFNSKQSDFYFIQGINVGVYAEDNSFTVAERFFTQHGKPIQRESLKKLANIIQERVNEYTRELGELVDKLEKLKLKRVREPLSVINFGQERLNNQKLSLYINGQQLQIKVSQEEDSYDQAFHIIEEHSLPKSSVVYIQSQIKQFQESCMYTHSSNKSNSKSPSSSIWNRNNKTPSRSNCVLFSPSPNGQPRYIGVNAAKAINKRNQQRQVENNYHQLSKSDANIRFNVESTFNSSTNNNNNNFNNYSSNFNNNNNYKSFHQSPFSQHKQKNKNVRDIAIDVMSIENPQKIAFETAQKHGLNNIQYNKLLETIQEQMSIH